MPEIIDFSDNMYCYKLINGNTMSKCITKPLFLQFLDWIDNFWSPAETIHSEFKQRCLTFYKKKTEKQRKKHQQKKRVGMTDTEIR